MSKRPPAARSFILKKTQRPAKRQKTRASGGFKSFGGPSADDKQLQATENASSLTSPSTRVVEAHVPTLKNLCLRAFDALFDGLETQDDMKEMKEQMKEWCRVLPDALVQALFASLRARRAAYLDHDFIVTCFMRGTSFSLNGDLKLIGSTLTSIPRLMGDRLRELEITDLQKFTDTTYQRMVEGLPSLTSLVLRNCTRVGPLTAAAIGKTCRGLRKLNLNFTSVTAQSLAPILENCVGLEVLKLAGVHNISDATITKLITTIFDGKDFDPNAQPLRNLRNLKLKHCSISDVGVFPILQRCPSLTHIDVSFTLLRHIRELSPVPPLEKLSLTSTFVPASEVIELLAQLPKLKVLNLGALGAGRATAGGPTSLTLDGDALLKLTDAMDVCAEIESVNLVQNARLGDRLPDAVGYFVSRVGRRCRYLNLAGIAFKSRHLAGLEMEADNSPPALRTLILNKTGVDDDAAPWLSCCTHLEELDLHETRITEDGLLSIIDSCPHLHTLNLTGCRGVDRADRRRFFEVWEERRGEDQ